MRSATKDWEGPLPMISIDISLVLQILGFFALLYVLNRFLYEPVQKVVEERDRRIGGTRKAAEELEKSVDQGLAEYERRLREAAVEGQEQRARVRQGALAEEKKILDKARREAADELARLRAELEADKARAMSALGDEAEGLSRTIVEKILDRPISAAVVLLAASLLAGAEPALASGGGGHGGGMGWKIFNFLVLAGGLYFVWTKYIKGALDDRAASIEKAMEEAREAKEKADIREREYREKLKLLDGRIDEIKREILLEAEAERERIIETAGENARRIKEQARLAAEQELKKARIELRREASLLAFELARKLLEKEVGAGDRERLAKEYIGSLKLH